MDVVLAVLCWRGVGAGHAFGVGRSLKIGIGMNDSTSASLGWSAVRESHGEGIELRTALDL